jgi:cyanophycin synthetase
VRLVEIRLLEGPNVYRLDPTVKIEVAVGRRRSWYGQREPGRHALVRLGATVGPREQPDDVRQLVAWCRRLRTDGGEGVGGVAAHRGSDPGHWIVSFPWTGAERARSIAEAAVELASRGVSSARRAQPTGGQARIVARAMDRIAGARTSPPSWIRDAERRIPIASISGTNGKSTVSRLITHILLAAGRRVGTTTSDGVYVDERLVDAGDWTGPGGAAMVLRRSDVDVAVLETARGGILLRGVGYESNEVSVLTNVSSDHLDLQGIHTLPELAEVKATICRITRADGRVVLNADDPYVAAVARHVRAPVTLFSIEPGGSTRYRRHVASGGLGWRLRRDALVRETIRGRELVIEVGDVPIAIGGLARHNLANALAAAAAAEALGASSTAIADGLRDFRPTAERSPGRLNLYRVGGRTVIVDFAHNEAGIEAVLDVAEGIAGGAAGRATPITIIIGTAGDRPDDTLRGMARIGARRADRVAVKETLEYLRGRSREHVVGELLAGAAEGGADPATIAVYPSETTALRAELTRANGASDGRTGEDRIVVLLCHEERDAVLELLADLGARPVDVTSELRTLVPRLQDRPRGD